MKTVVSVIGGLLTVLFADALLAAACQGWGQPSTTNLPCDEAWAQRIYRDVELDAQ